MAFGRAKRKLTPQQVAAIRYRYEQRTLPSERVGQKQWDHWLAERSAHARLLRESRKGRFAPIKQHFDKLHEQEIRKLIQEEYMRGAGPGQFDAEARQRVANKLRRLRNVMGANLKFAPEMKGEELRKARALKSKKVRSRIKNALANNKSPFPDRYETYYLAERLYGAHSPWQRFDPLPTLTSQNLRRKKTLKITDDTLVDEFNKSQRAPLPSYQSKLLGIFSNRAHKPKDIQLRERKDLSYISQFRKKNKNR